MESENTLKSQKLSMIQTGGHQYVLGFAPAPEFLISVYRLHKNPSHENIETVNVSQGLPAQVDHLHLYS